MNEPPGARLRVALSGLTMAEYFRDEGPGRAALHRQHLPVRAGGLGGVGSARPHAVAPSATSRRSPPRWASSRNASPPRKQGSITSVQAVYVPADDLTDPAPARTFAHLDAFIVLSRPISEKGIYPAVDPLAVLLARSPAAGSSATSTTHDDARAGDPPALQGPSGHHRHPRHGRALRRGQAHRVARPQDRALPLAADERGRGVHRRVRAST